MIKTKIILMLGMVGLFTGCMTSAVKPSYVSPAMYQNLNCIQLQSESDRIQQYIAQGVTPAKRNLFGIGLGLGGGFGGGGWGIVPSISVNLGQSSDSRNTQLSQLLGQQDAIAQAARFKGCSIKVAPK
ncbi:hypothetical protein [Acinetobacter rathckeae]|uniref:hypothetical protein n=1 Tax=Acinetobacter rathckeae TaxID=2605272 RepID=UPI003899354E